MEIMLVATVVVVETQGEIWIQGIWIGGLRNMRRNMNWKWNWWNSRNLSKIWPWIIITIRIKDRILRISWLSNKWPFFKEWWCYNRTRIINMSTLTINNTWWILICNKCIWCREDIRLWWEDTHNTQMIKRKRRKRREENTPAAQALIHLRNHRTSNIPKRRRMTLAIINPEVKTILRYFATSSKKEGSKKRKKQKRRS